jgi:hypothetical protein
MSDSKEVSEAMIAAAIGAALPLKINAHDMQKILTAAMSKLSPRERGAPFPIRVNDSIAVKRARFLGPTERRCYYRVETECGKLLTIHGNEILPSNG